MENLKINNPINRKVKTIKLKDENDKASERQTVNRNRPSCEFELRRSGLKAKLQVVPTELSELEKQNLLTVSLYETLKKIK